MSKQRGISSNDLLFVPIIHGKAVERALKGTDLIPPDLSFLVAVKYLTVDNYGVSINKLSAFLGYHYDTTRIKVMKLTDGLYMKKVRDHAFVRYKAYSALYSLSSAGEQIISKYEGHCTRLLKSASVQEL